MLDLDAASAALEQLACFNSSSDRQIRALTQAFLGAGQGNYLQKSPFPRSASYRSTTLVASLWRLVYALSMPTIIPHSELTKRALAWISEQPGARSADTKALESLLDEAAMRFNLGPLDVDFLRRALRNTENGPHST